MRMVTNNPTKLLDELQQGLIEDVRVSTSVLCETLKKVGLTRRKIYTLSELLRVETHPVLAEVQRVVLRRADGLHGRERRVGTLSKNNSMNSYGQLEYLSRFSSMTEASCFLRLYF